MGLLDQILGGLSGNARGGPPSGDKDGGGMSRVMMALLPIVLGMLANRQGGGPGGTAMPGGLGSLGNLGSLGGLGALGGVLGGLGGSGGAGGLGGLQGLLDQFSQRGYAEQANSWVSTGPNQPLPPEALSQVFGEQQIAGIASQAGVSEDEARTGLSQLLPELVDRLTPNGQLPDEGQLMSSLGDYGRHLPR